MNWFMQLVRRRRLLDDLAAEVEQHLDEKIELLISEGMSREEAIAMATRDFGNVPGILEDARTVWRRPWLDNLVAGLRHCGRAVRQHSLAAVGVTVLMLALAVTQHGRGFQGRANPSRSSIMQTISVADPQALRVVTAIQTGNVDQLRQLLLDRPDLATARIVDGNGFGRTLLHIATDWPGHFANGPQTVVALIAAGADPNAPVMDPSRPANQETPLHWAASANDVAVINALLDHGANIEAPGAVLTGGTPISDAVVFAQWDAARRLLDRGARTTLAESAALGLLDRVAESCMRQPPPSSEGLTRAFWSACRGGQFETARFLLSRGAQLNWVGYDGKTPLEAAQDSGATTIVDWLHSRGARPASGA